MIEFLIPYRGMNETMALCLARINPQRNTLVVSEISDEKLVYDCQDMARLATSLFGITAEKLIFIQRRCHPGGTAYEQEQIRFDPLFGNLYLNPSWHSLTDAEYHALLTNGILPAGHNHLLPNGHSSYDLSANP